MFRILQESLIALKTILKEIDPFAFEEALRMNTSQKKQFAVKQDDDDRKNFDKKWDRLHLKLKQQDGGFNEPDGNHLIFIIEIVPFKQSTLIRDFNDLYQKIYDKEKYINL